MLLYCDRFSPLFRRPLQLSAVALLALFCAVSLCSCEDVESWTSSFTENGGGQKQESESLVQLVEQVISERFNSDSLASQIRGNMIQRVVVPAVPQSATFAGEEVPLHFSDVRESLIRELTAISYMHSSLVYTIQLSGRYRERVCRILRSEGVPEDFFYLCIAESMLQPLTSSAAAAGYWQFLKGTGKEYGLIIDSEVDQRYDWEASTRAACKYLKKARERYGNWTLAAASYNIGTRNIDKRSAEQQTRNYYDMQLPQETARYLFRAIAYKTIMENPSAYGFDIKEEDLFREPEHKMVTVKGSIASWSKFAKSHGTNFKLLKMYNEWIRSNKLSNGKGRRFEVFIPEREVHQSE